MPENQTQKIGVAVLGSTGSIGKSTLSVIERHDDLFEVVALTANRSLGPLCAQIWTHSVKTAVVGDASVLTTTDDLPKTDWKFGQKGLLEVVTDPEVDIVVNAIVGAAGLRISLATLEAGKKLALANKESLVIGGSLIQESLNNGGGELIPIDSEHSGIFQCVAGEESRAVSRIILTASGGPFRKFAKEDMEKVTLEQALKHPTWEMGPKVSIDSATLANKALEIIEAHFLFGIDYDSISAVVHPPSIVHSFVEFIDGSILAQLGFPTMELPILFALTYPKRRPDSKLRSFDPVSLPLIEFEDIDEERFPIFRLGLEAGKRGGTAPSIFNASNEVAVEAFVNRQIRFTQIASIIGETVRSIEASEVKNLEDVLEADKLGRESARELVESL